MKKVLNPVEKERGLGTKVRDRVEIIGLCASRYEHFWVDFRRARAAPRVAVLNTCGRIRTAPRAPVKLHHLTASVRNEGKPSTRFLRGEEAPVHRPLSSSTVVLTLSSVHALRWSCVCEFG